MLLTLLGTIYIFLLALAFGLVIACAVARLLPPDDRTPAPLALLLLAGLAAIASLLTVISLVHGVSLVVHPLVIGVAVAALAASRRSARALLSAYWKERAPVHPLVLGIGSVAAILFLARSSAPPNHYDVGLYYAQALRWLYELGSVPGLGNLHHPLANNSAWHVLQAYFGFSAIAGGPLPSLNVFIVGLGEWIALGCLNRIFTRSLQVSDLVGALTVVPLTAYFGADFSSPITDISTGTIGCLVFVLLVRRADRRELLAPNVEAVLLGLTCAFAVTIKLSMVPLALFAAIAALVQFSRCRRQALVLVAGMALAAIPWAARGVVLSGYAIYPLPGVPALPVDWAVPNEKVTEAAHAIQAWSRIPFRPLDEVAALPLAIWVPQWWSRQNAVMQMTIAVAAITPVIALIAGLLTARWAGGRFPGMGRWLVLICLWYGGMWFWFLGAPQPRYGLGFILPLGLVAMATLLYAPIRALRALGPLALALGIMLFQGAELAKVATKTQWRERWLTPAPYIATITRVTIVNDYPLVQPILGDQCWDAPLPCAPVESPSVMLRGCALRQGFRTDTTSGNRDRSQCPPLELPLDQSSSSGAPPVWIGEVQVYRRNPNEIKKIACLANRRNLLRVVVRNRGDDVAGPLEVDAIIDGSTRLRGTIASVGSGREADVEIDIPGTLQVGTHTLEARITAVSNPSGVLHETETEFPCLAD